MHKYFLLNFDPKTRSSEVDEFADIDEAFTALREAERSLGDTHEVVLFLAESLDALKMTHSSYFAYSALNGDRAPVNSEHDSSVEELASVLNEIVAEREQVEQLLEQIT